MRTDLSFRPSRGSLSIEPDVDWESLDFDPTEPLDERAHESDDGSEQEIDLTDLLDSPPDVGGSS